jgi:hypothetical protein
MKKTNTLSPEKLYRLNKTNQELVQLLSPEINASHQELFYKKSGDQKKFNKELKNKSIDLLNKETYPELEEA